MKKALILFLLPFLMGATCQKRSLNPLGQEKYTIKSGQNFGMCMGKCYNELIITPNKLTFIQRELTYPGKFKTYDFNETKKLKEIQQYFTGFETDRFMVLEEVIGCPDCADGGSEWLEISYETGKNKRVTFEYGKTLPGFEELIKNLREERHILNKKYQ